MGLALYVACISGVPGCKGQFGMLVEGQPVTQEGPGCAERRWEHSAIRCSANDSTERHRVKSSYENHHQEVLKPARIQ